MAPAINKPPAGAQQGSRIPNIIKNRKLKPQACSMQELGEEMRDVNINKDEKSYYPPSRTRHDWYWKNPNVMARRSARLLDKEKTEEKRKKEGMAAVEIQEHEVAGDTDEDGEAEMEMNEDDEMEVDGNEELDKDPRGRFPGNSAARSGNPAARGGNPAARGGNPAARGGNPAARGGPEDSEEDSDITFNRVLNLLGMIAVRQERQKAE